MLENITESLLYELIMDLYNWTELTSELYNFFCFCNKLYLRGASDVN